MSAGGPGPHRGLPADRPAGSTTRTPRPRCWCWSGCTPPEEAEPPAAPPASPTEARVLALPAGGATTARAARETGLTVDGVRPHLRRLSARWSATGRTEPVARACALGVSAPGMGPAVVLA
ncbi:hypothetical protein [Streptomyces heilongjiangensis]|uniref:HTH luxR-type domain-containing protein n=1 Tax=Streptomyces heilongjiangensis TaxID=945052 RepID=A0ABW1AZ89_9ACTN